MGASAPGAPSGSRNLGKLFPFLGRLTRAGVYLRTSTLVRLLVPLHPAPAPTGEQESLMANAAKAPSNSRVLKRTTQRSLAKIATANSASDDDP